MGTGTTKEQSTYTACQALILALGGELEALLDPTRARQVKTAMTDLRDNRFEVAVMGEIKAGKSLLLNGLIERPDFLPHDVNPWTAVITHLHLGHKRQSGADFHFLNREEWQAMVEGADRERGFAEQMADKWRRVKGEEGAQTEKDLQTLVERVRRRFEGKLSTLLGATHTHENAQEVFKRYVASGEGSHDGSGEFTDIVREAEVYLPMAPFDTAVSLVDTPGTNDPFTLREKRTLDYVSRAHAFVFVTSATQPFKASDEAHLRRLMAVLNKDRIVVVVNRVDQLNKAEEVDRVLARVREEVTARFKNIQMDVLPVSAYWASLAAKARGGDEEAELEIADDGKLKKFARHRGLTVTADPSELTELAWQLSGVTALRQAVERKLLATRGQALLAAALRTPRDLVQQAEAELQISRTELLRRADARERDSQEALRLIADLQEKNREAGRFAERVDQGLADFRAHLEKVAAETAAELGQSLGRLAHDKAEDVRRHFAAVEISVRGVEKWSSDYSDLRSGMRAEFDRKVRQAVDGQKRELRHTAGGLKDSVPPGLSKGDTARRFDFLLEPPEAVEAPDAALGLLGTRAEIELGSWWSRWWSGSETQSQKAQELGDQVLHTGSRAAMKLASEAERVVVGAFREHLASIDDAIEAVGSDVRRQKVKLDEERAELERGGGPAVVAAQVQKLRDEAAQAQARAGLFGSLRARFEAVQIPKTAEYQ